MSGARRRQMPFQQRWRMMTHDTRRRRGTRDVRFLVLKDSLLEGGSPRAAAPDALACEEPWW